MLKKITALFLCLTLAALAVLPAMAENSQLTKLQGQWQSSGFRGTLKGEVTGEPSALIGEENWALLKRLFAGYQMDITHTVKNSRVNEGDESVITLTSTAGKEVGRLNILTDASGVIYLQSDLLDEAGLYYAFDSGFDWSRMILSNESDWPSLLHVLTEVAQANKTWQDKAAPYMEQFSLNVSRWLQGYLNTTTEQSVDGTYVTTAVYEIPAPAMLQETIQMLTTLYSNGELLNLLAEVLTVEEQAAYLQGSAMLQSFLRMLNNVKLEGTVRVRRQYETVSGKVLFDSVTLPCPESLPVSLFSLVHVPTAEEGELWQLSLTMDAEKLGVALGQDLTLDVTAQNTDTDVWTGSVLVLLPGSEDPEALIQEDQTLFSCTYNLNAPAPKDVSDFYQSRYERRYETTLVVKPDGQTGLPEFSIEQETVIYSKRSGSDAVTYVDSAVSLRDLDQESAVNLTFSGKTAQRWTPTMLTDALSSALRMDLMNPSSRLELLGQLFGHLTQTLAKRMIGQ